MKKYILPKTILFIFIISFINIFIFVFGKENSLVAVMIITMLLMLLQRNLAVSPIKNTLKLVGINLFLGIVSFLSIQNIYLGIICNLVAMFIVAYLFSYNLNSHLDIAFGLLYLFMIGAPINIEQLPLRLTSLLVGSLIIMISQILFNKNKLEKYSDKNFKIISSYILQKANDLKNSNEFNENLNLKINTSIKQIKNSIYNNRKEDFLLSQNAVYIFDIVFNLERINTILDEYGKDIDSYDKEILEIISSELNNLNSYFNNKGEYQIETILKNSTNTQLYEFYDAIENIYYNLSKYKNNKSREIIYDSFEIPFNFKKSYILKNHLNTKSMKFTYAMKVGIGIAIGGFIMDYFNLREGRWILYTIFSIIQPYTEDGIIKTKKRTFGTVFGCIAIFILFSIFKNPTTRSIIIMVVGYLSAYAKEIDYKYEMICITISAIGAVSIFTSPYIFIINRMTYILIGIIIALSINKLVFPYNLNTAHKTLDSMYQDVLKELKREFKLLNLNQHNSYKLRNLLLISHLIEDKLISINKLINNKNQDNILNKNRSLTNSMYCMFLKLNTSNKNYSIE